MDNQRESDLINKAQDIASTLTYNDDKPQAAAKHTLLELSHLLSRKCTDIKTCNGRLQLHSLSGHFRNLTFRECIGYRLLGIIPKM